VACERFWDVFRSRYHLIPIRLGAKATVGALRGGLRVPRQFRTRRRVSMVLLILIQLSAKAMVGAPRGEIRVQLSAARAVVLIPIRLGAKATPGALRGGLATVRGLLYHTCVLTNLILLPGTGPRGSNDSGLAGSGSML
jgi:hypothetical protein